MNLPAASCETSKAARNEASFGEFTPRDYEETYNEFIDHRRLCVNEKTIGR